MLHLIRNKQKYKEEEKRRQQSEAMEQEAKLNRLKRGAKSPLAYKRSQDNGTGRRPSIELSKVKTLNKVRTCGIFPDITSSMSPEKKFFQGYDPAVPQTKVFLKTRRNAPSQASLLGLTKGRSSLYD